MVNITVELMLTKSVIELITHRSGKARLDRFLKLNVLTVFISSLLLSTFGAPCRESTFLCRTITNVQNYDTMRDAILTCARKPTWILTGAYPMPGMEACTCSCGQSECELQVFAEPRSIVLCWARWNLAQRVDLFYNIQCRYSGACVTLWWNCEASKGPW